MTDGWREDRRKERRTSIVGHDEGQQKMLEKRTSYRTKEPGRKEEK